MKEEITAYYDALAPQYDQNRFENSYGQYIHEQERHVLEKYLSKNPKALNLDLACGTGRFMHFASIGVDASAEMVRMAQTKFPQKEIIFGNAEELPFSDFYFENVFSFHLFMHLNEIELTIIAKEVHRVLKKDGYFIFDVPSEKRRKWSGYKSKDWHGAYQISIEKVNKLFEKDWEIVNFQGVAFFPLHRIPKPLRKAFWRLDNWFCSSFWKAYSSHHIFILKKK